MAKTQDEPPGTAGSQFYVVTGDEVPLPPGYAVLGKLAEGLYVADRIAGSATPTAASRGRPCSPW